MTTAFHSVAKVSEVAENRPMAVRVNGVSIALCNVGGTIYAIANICSHDDGILVEEGASCLEGFEIECPRHGARFDVRDGSVLSMPAAYPIASYETKVENGTIFVKVSQDE